MTDILTDVETLLRRIWALEQLLSFYRTGKHPSEKVFNTLDETRNDTAKLREKYQV